MSSRKVIGTLVGLAACAAVAYGLHGLILTGNCGGDGYPPCPPESTPYFLAVGIGMPVAIIAGFVSTRGVAFALFPAVAAACFWAGFDLPPGERSVPFAVGGTFLAVMLLPLAVIPFGLRKRRLVHRLVTTGGQAIGTVTDIRDTGVTINHNPRVELKLRIEPTDGSSTFEGVKTITASRVKLPYRGQRFPVWFDPADRSSFVVGLDVGPNPTPEVRRLFELAEQGNPPRPGDPQAGDPLDRLAKLNELRLSGALTETEFAEQKAKILGSSD